MESMPIIADENRFGDTHVVGSLAAQADQSGYIPGYFRRSCARFSIALIFCLGIQTTRPKVIAMWYPLQSSNPSTFGLDFFPGKARGGEGVISSQEKERFIYL